MAVIKIANFNAPERRGQRSALPERQFSVGFGIPSNNHARPYAHGNLDRGILGTDSPYAGREYGGVNRVSRCAMFCVNRRCSDRVRQSDVIYGTARFGSGYPYGANGYYVDNRPFPFGFWPVPISNHYYCQNDCVCHGRSDERLQADIVLSQYYGHEDQRPGGRTATAEIKSKISSTS
jgi:hypothetical protein